MVSVMCGWTIPDPVERRDREGGILGHEHARSRLVLFERELATRLPAFHVGRVNR